MATQQRGFASMNPEKQREIASKGGKAAHQKGTAHQFSPEEARAAGRKGGEAVSRNAEHMAEIGRRGGVARSNRASNVKTESPALENDEVDRTAEARQTPQPDGLPPAEKPEASAQP